MRWCYIIFVRIRLGVSSARTQSFVSRVVCRFHRSDRTAREVTIRKKRKIEKNLGPETTHDITVILNTKETNNIRVHRVDVQSWLALIPAKSQRREKKTIRRYCHDESVFTDLNLYYLVHKPLTILYYIEQMISDREFFSKNIQCKMYVIHL